MRHVYTERKNDQPYLGVFGAGFELLLLLERALLGAGLEVADRRSQSIDISAQGIALQRRRERL
jgi:hypothetical protein